MIRSFFGLALLILFYFIYGLYLSAFDVNALPPQIQRQNPSSFFDYKGVTNVYSNLSLGSGDLKEIVADAKSAALDFLFITDLNVFDQNPLVEGYHDRLLVMAAGKFNYLDSRLLFYSTDQKIKGDSPGSAHIQITDLLSQTSTNSNSAFVLTHPFLKGFGWSGDYPPGLNGIEVINFRRVQQQHWDASKFDSAISLLIYPFNPELAFVRLLDDPNDELNLLDELQKKQPTTAHLGLEATAKAVPFTGSTINFPRYETLFGLGATHLLLRSELTGKINSDKFKLIKAIRDGEFYISLDVLGNPKGFNAVMKDRDDVYLMGANVKLRKGLQMQYQVPQANKEFEVSIFKNGQSIFTSGENQGSLPITEKGVYRMLVKLKLNLPFPMKPRWIHWIYTNSFYVKD